MESCPTIVPGSVYRSFRRGAAWERVGCGFLDKSGRSLDQLDYLAPTWSQVWVLEGVGTYRLDGAEAPLGPGSCFQRQPGRRHSTILDPRQPWLEGWVDCGAMIPAAMLAGGVLRADPCVWRVRQVPVQELLAFRRDLETAADSELPGLFARALALVVAGQAEAVGSPAEEDPIALACRLLAEDGGGREGLRTWCARRGLEYERFRKDFTRRMGEPPGQYRIRRRLERACALLQAGGTTVAGVARALGYASPYEFSAQFSSRFGLPPSAFAGTVRP